MGRILIIDSEDRSIEDVKKQLLTINPQLQIQFYTNFHDFENELIKMPPEQVVEFFKFDLFIFDYGLLKPNDWEAKLNDLKKRNQAQATLCFSTYDNVNTNRKHLLQLQAFNVLYKPFDPLILKESLNIVLKEKQNIRPIEIKAQSTNAQVAIMKEIELSSICELGFVTMNEGGAIPANSTAKYFSELFLNGKKQSVWAQCLVSLEVPNKPGFFINKFQFIGLETQTLMNIRRYIQTNKHKRVANAVWNLNDHASGRTVNLAFVDTKPEDKSNPLKKDIEANFKNVKIDFVQLDLSKKTESFSQKYDLVINISADIKTEEIKNRFLKDTLFVLVSPVPLKDENLKLMSNFYRDVFIQPVDKSYFKKKIKIFIQELNYKESTDLLNVSCAEKIKATNMVQISEICELYVNLSYPRELQHGSFREFAFISEDESQIIELPGFCNFTEKTTAPPGKTGPYYFHQFIFWGMTDHYLKQIRIWLLQNYIKQNQDKAS